MEPLMFEHGACHVQSMTSKNVQYQNATVPPCRPVHQALVSDLHLQAWLQSGQGNIIQLHWSSSGVCEPCFVWSLSIIIIIIVVSHSG